MQFGHRAGEHGTNRAVYIAGHLHELDLFALVDSRTALGDEHVVQCFFQAVVLGQCLETGNFGGYLRLGKHATEVQALCLPVLDAFARVQQIRAANQIVKLANAQLGHDLAHFFSDKKEVVHYMLRLAGELGAQDGVLGRYTDRAGIQVALAHHDAALHHQGGGGKAELIGTEQGADGHVTAGLHLAIGLHTNPATQSVQHEGLLGFGQADFPGATAMLDGRPGRCTGTTVMARNNYMVSLALGHTGCNRAYTNFRHQFHADSGVRCHVLQVVNQLGQVFDRINVVVRRWRDQPHARHRMAESAYVFGNLAAG